MTDTIFALATVRGRAGVAVIRVSGPDAFLVAEGMAGSVPPLREARLRVLRDPATGDEVDQALVVAFPENQSFTGEKTVEFHIHGSIAVQDFLLGLLLADKRSRIAEPGEFTRRAMENGQLDLSQVEGLADLIDAETEFQRRQAMRAMRGVLGELAAKWRARLVRASALVEATIDFSDEELPPDLVEEARDLTRTVIDDLQAQVAGSDAAERIRDGYEVAIVGAPNAGKSTLLNYLAGRDAAITSEIAGTTRDVLEVRMDIRGLPVTLLDTAGVRETDDRLEALGVARARARAAEADLRIFLRSSGEDENWADLARDGDIFAVAKADLGGPTAELGVSGLTGLGVDKLLSRIAAILAERASGASAAIRVRHRLAMEGAISALESALDHVKSGPEFSDLAAEDYRSALRFLDSLIGRVDVEALLDEIFASFCLGK